MLLTFYINGIPWKKFAFLYLEYLIKNNVCYRKSIWNMPLKIFDKKVHEIQSISDILEVHVCARAIMSDSSEQWNQWSSTGLITKPFKWKVWIGYKMKAMYVAFPNG